MNIPFFHEWTWKHLESCLDFWYLDWWPNFSHIASYHCFSKWTKNGPKICTVMCYVKPPTYTVAGQFLVLLQRIHGSAHLADWNKQTNHNWIWSTKYKWNFWRKKVKKKNWKFLKISSSVDISDLLTKLITTVINDLNIGWIPRNFKIFILKLKLSFLRVNHKNDI